MQATIPLRGLILIAALLLSSCALPQQETSLPRQLTILGTGDLQAHLDGRPRNLKIPGTDKELSVAGGIGRIATLIRNIEEENNHPVIVVSSGDDLMGRYFHKFKGKAIFGLMEDSGYQVLALGNHEFDEGPGVLAEALGSVGFPALCSDLAVKGTVMEGHCQPWLLREYQGLKVGFFSLMTEDFPLVTLPGKVRLKNDPAITAEHMVDLLRQKGAEVIIAVTHIGNKQDRELAAQVNGIDIIFGGHSHNYELQLERVNKTLIVNGGEKGPALVRLDLALDGDGRAIPDSAAYQLIPVREEIRPDAAVEQRLQEYRNQLPAATVIGTTDREWDLTNNALRYRESTVADLITDIIREQFKVDIVLYNSGAFRGNAKYPPGPVTDVMIGDIDEFESTVFVLSLQGRYIAQVLEHSAAQIGTGGFLQVSGIRFTLDPRAQAQKLSREAKDGPTIIQPGRRVRDIQVLSPGGQWEPLDPDRTYRLAANDFMVARGGNGYYWFGRYGKDIRDTYSTMGSVMIDFFRRNGSGGPADPDGRITIR
jgi:5'-nucleotidase